MSNKMEPNVLAASVLAVMTAQVAQANTTLDSGLSASLGYGAVEHTVLTQSGGSAIFDELGSQLKEELDNAAVLSQLDDNRRFIAQADVLGNKQSEFQPLHIEGTLSSIYDFVSIEDQGHAQLAQVNIPEPQVTDIVYASVKNDFGYTAITSSSVVASENPNDKTITDYAVNTVQPTVQPEVESAADTTSSSVDFAPNPYAKMSTDEAVALLENQQASSGNGEVISSAVVPQETGTVGTVSNASQTVQPTAVEMAAKAQAQPAESVTKTQPVAPKPAATPSMVPKETNASDILKQQEDDATSEKNLEEVFTASEKRYSLLKQGNWGLNYDARYSYYRDSRIDIATAEGSSNILRFRVDEDAQHTLTNSFNVQYGLRDNLTLSADLPIVAKTDRLKDKTIVGLGDISLGARWEPFPLEKDRLPLIFNGNITLPTGDSPYDIARDDLSTGRGYYGIGGGVSTRKYIDPVVLFGSASLNYGFQKDGFTQQLGGNRELIGIRPNLGAGISLGFAYSLNYDVSLTMSYQQSFSIGSEFTVRETEVVGTQRRVTERSSSSADQTSASLNMALGVRVSPKTIVNTSVGIGLTEDTPDVSLGVSFPLDFAGLKK